MRIAKTEGALCLQDQVFISARGFILPTYLKMNRVADDAGLTLVKKWHKFVVLSPPSDSSDIINFTFDKKQEVVFKKTNIA